MLITSKCAAHIVSHFQDPCTFIIVKLRQTQCYMSYQVIPIHHLQHTSRDTWTLIKCPASTLSNITTRVILKKHDCSTKLKQLHKPCMTKTKQKIIYYQLSFVQSHSPGSSTCIPHVHNNITSKCVAHIVSHFQDPHTLIIVKFWQIVKLRRIANSWLYFATSLTGSVMNWKHVIFTKTNSYSTIKKQIL